MIVAKVNLLRIPKDRIINGEKGKYIDLVIVKKKEADEYGHTHFVAVSQTKEERESKAKTIFVGQAKEFGQKMSKEEVVKVESNQRDDFDLDEQSDDLPF